MRESVVETIPKQSGGAEVGHRVLFISNGHGEDLLAGVLAEALHEKCPYVESWAFPIVGTGQAYERFPVKVVGTQKEMPSGGWIRQSFAALREDVKAGFLKLTWQQWQALKALRNQVSHVVAVGDIYALYLAYRFVAKPLAFVPTAKSDYIRSHLAIEKHLMKKYCQIVLARDELTATNLRHSQIPAQYVGNLMMDAIFPSGRSLPGIWPGKKVIGILPGSREEAYTNLPLLCITIDEIATKRPDIVFAVALAGNLSLDKTATILGENGWQVVHVESPMGGDEGDGTIPKENNRARWLVKGKTRLLVAQGRFGDVLDSSSLCLGMAGTANEQAAGLGRPVVAFPGSGSQFTAKFLRAQKRLLGDALEAARDPRAAGQAVLEILTDPTRYAVMAACGRERMGEPGGAKRMATELIRLWSIQGNG
jgi:uncharacterized protein (TIGR03492 family)